MDAIGVGLIGAGYMGKSDALAWTGVRAVFGDTPIVRRIALCEADEGLARRRAEEFGFETSTADWRALIADPAVEAVSITTPNALHAPIAIALSNRASMFGARGRWRPVSRLPNAWRRRLA
jgi:predicted dehydrogenase